MRCMQLGFELDRRELDGVYREFVHLADENKSVNDAEIIELISDICVGQIKKDSADASADQSSGPHNAAPIPAFPLAHLGPAGEHALGRERASAIFDHEGDQQEDYLWGV